MYSYGKDVPLSVEILSSENMYLLQSFHCGDPNIDSCILDDARSPKTVSYLFVNVEKDELVAYCSISCAGIVRHIEDLDTMELIPKTSSAIEIDFFAVSSDYRGLRFSETSERYDTLSATIFDYCITHILDISLTVVGAEMIVLYSVPNALSFYQHRGFTAFHSNMAQDKDPFLKGCIPVYYPL